MGGYANRSEAAGFLSGKTREGCCRDVRLRLRLLRLRPYAEKKLVGGRQIVYGVGQEDTYIRKQSTNA